MERNRGFSLVELIVAMAILSFVMMIAMSFMMTGSRSFTKGNADSTVQKEAELTVNQIEDMIIDLNGGVFGTDDDAKTELLMYHAEEDGSGGVTYSKSAVRWDKSDKNVYCSKWDVSYDASTGTFTDGAAEYADQLLAEHVTDFKVDLSDTQTTKAMDGTTRTIVKSVLVSVGYDDGTGAVDYATSPVITLRNRMLLSDNPANIFDERKPMAETLALHYSGAETSGIVVPIVDRVSEVTRGSAYNIYAKIKSGSDVNELVNWVIEETGTLSTIDANGYLSVGTYEANAYLTITAQYKSNPNKKATGVVKVVGTTPLKSLESVHIAPQALVPFAPEYEAIPVTKGFTKEEENAITYQWTVKVMGEGGELSDVVKPFADNNKTLSLTIEKEEANFGRMLDITVAAFSAVTNETRYANIKYRIDDNIDADGDSNMQRGKGEDSGDGDVDFGMCKDGLQNTTCEYKYYFCNPEGKKLDAYDSLLDCIRVDAFGGWGDSYHLVFTKRLPMNQEFYVKVIAYYEGLDHGMKVNWSRERIHYIPAVQIYGKTRKNTGVNVAGRFTFKYTVVGYWENTWVDSEPFEYKMESIDYAAPAGVVVTPRFVKTYVDPDEKKTIGAQGVWDVNTDDWTLKNQIEFKSMTIRISLKDEPSIYALATIIFE